MCGWTLGLAVVRGALRDSGPLAAAALRSQAQSLFGTAAGDGAVECVRVLLAAGADPSFGGESLVLTRSELALEVIERNRGEVCRQLTPVPDRQRRRWRGYVLALALQEEWDELTEEVLSLGEVDCEMRTEWGKGYTPLMVAIWMGKFEVAERLLASGADPGAKAEGPTGERTLDLRHFAEISKDRAGALELLARGRLGA